MQGQALNFADLETFVSVSELTWFVGTDPYEWGFNSNQYTNPKREFINLQNYLKAYQSSPGLFFKYRFEPQLIAEPSAGCWGHRDKLDTGFALWELPNLCVCWVWPDTFLLWNHIAWETKSQSGSSLLRVRQEQGRLVGGWTAQWCLWQPGSCFTWWGELAPGVELAQPLFLCSSATQHCHGWPQMLFALSWLPTVP